MFIHICMHVLMHSNCYIQRYKSSHNLHACGQENQLQLYNQVCSLHSLQRSIYILQLHELSQNVQEQHANQKYNNASIMQHYITTILKVQSLAPSQNSCTLYFGRFKLTYLVAKLTGRCQLYIHTLRYIQLVTCCSCIPYSHFKFII